MGILLRLQIGGGRISHLPNDIRCHGVCHFKALAAQERCKNFQKKLCFMFHLSKMQSATLF